MRRLANQYIAEALGCTLLESPWEEAIDCIVCDFCQNLALPYLGANQPGETYCFSPLGVYCFGVADLGQEDHHLHALHLPRRRSNERREHSRVSLVEVCTRTKGWIDTTQGPRKHLIIIMDNCGGQNKNKMVLRLAVLLVELGYYKKVTCLFLVAGHTKNSCDRLFNVLKSMYRKSDLFTMDQLMTACDDSECVTPVRVMTDRHPRLRSIRRQVPEGAEVRNSKEVSAVLVR